MKKRYSNCQYCGNPSGGKKHCSSKCRYNAFYERKKAGLVKGRKQKNGKYIVLPNGVEFRNDIIGAKIFADMVNNRLKYYRS